MQPIMLATVPYTGTRFFTNLIEEHTERKAFQLTYKAVDKPFDWYKFVWCHLEPANMGLFMPFIDKFDPIIVTTVRDLHDLKGSWNVRGQNPVRMKQSLWLADIFTRLYDPIIVSVDTPGRDAMLEVLGNALGKELTTDWRPIGHNS